MARSTRRVLTDAMWDRVEPLLPKREPSPKGGRPPADDRECLEGLLWLLRAGARWQDVPVDLPSGSTCWRRLRDWSLGGHLEAIHAALLADLEALGKIDLSELVVDATFVRAKRGGDDVGKTKWGKGTKIEAVVDATGLPLGVAIAAANVPETELATTALEAAPVRPPAGTPVLADKQYDSDPLRDEFAERGLVLLSPHRRNRKRASRNDGRRMRRYRRRYVVERTMSWFEHFRRVAMRWEHESYLYEGLVLLAMCFMDLSRF
jgi:transposase